MATRGIILAAGRGSRMGSLTTEKPKCLLEVAGRSLLEWQIRAFEKSGITKIAIVTGYLREKIIEKFQFTEFYNKNWNKTNMVASLFQADSWLNESDCIVSYADIFYKESAIQLLESCQSRLAITYDPNWRKLWDQRFEDPLSDAETFSLNQDGFLMDIGGTPESYETIQGQYMGLLKFTPSGWIVAKNLVSKTSVDNLSMTKFLQKLVNLNEKIQAVEYDEVWGEVDSVKDLYLYKNTMQTF